MLEQPQIDEWVRTGAFFISTGYAVRDDKDALLKLIQTLYDRHAAGLAIKTRFFHAFPKKVWNFQINLVFHLY